MRRGLHLLPLPILLVLLLLLAPGLAAQDGDPDGDADSARAETEAAPADSADADEPGDFDRLTEDAERLEGLFDLYRTDEKLYMAVPRERLGEEMLLSFQISRGIGAAGLFGGTMLSIFEPAVVALEEHGGEVYLLQRPHRYRASDEDPAAREAVELTFGSSVLESARIAAEREEDGMLLIDVLPWMVSDLSGVSERVRRAASENGGQPTRGALDPRRSYLEGVRAFPRNLNFRALLTYGTGDGAPLRSVPDPRWIPVSIHTTLAALPDDPMEPRLADERVGYFMTVHKDFSDYAGDDFFVRQVNRWRLECAAAPGPDGLCDPVRPIVYHIDRSVPEAFRATIAEAIEAFQPAFEEAGFRDAIRAELLPDDAEAEDIRYATIRWNTSDEPGYGAIGPSIVDPRTGEILDADVLIEGTMILRFAEDWRTGIDPAAAFEQVLDAPADELAALAAGAETAGFGAELAAQGTLVRSLLAARGEIGPGDPVPAEYMHQALKWVTMHEVGHTLGLRHNFRSSADTPNDRLHDTEWTSERGVFSSVMEYPVANIASDGEENGHFYNAGVGTYDRWAIAYGYTPDPDRASELARLSALPGHAYGTDEDARGPGALDPTVNVYDLGADPLAWAMERAELIHGIWPRIPEFALDDNEPYSNVTHAYTTLLGQYARTLGTAVKYIGGQHQYRDRMGDPDERGPFVNVPRERQLRALEFVAERGFSEEAFRLPADVLGSFGAERWSHWGRENTWNGRIDFPVHRTVLSLQTSLLERITHPMLLARIRDAELRYGAREVLGIPELMETLASSVWSEVWTGSVREIGPMRRDLQRAHLERLVTLVTDPPEETPADATAVARVVLGDLDERIGRTLEGGRLDAMGRAHLEESRVRIRRALEAGMTLGG